jgi:hypothetical protein
MKTLRETLIEIWGDEYDVVDWPEQQAHYDFEVYNTQKSQLRDEAGVLEVINVNKTVQAIKDSPAEALTDSSIYFRTLARLIVKQ